MPSNQELLPFINQPREDLAAEYKDWLDINDKHHKALLAKAVIAMANHGGGFIVIGFVEIDDTLVSRIEPDNSPAITQDLVNGIVTRYCSPGFHCQVHYLEHRETKARHPVVAVPGSLSVPVMSKRDHTGVISANRCYMRKPGPRSEEPNTGEEWRSLLDRCIRAGRSEMLDAIRTILHGQVHVQDPSVDAVEELTKFCEAAHRRWQELIRDEQPDSPVRFPLGFYEMGFSFVGAPPLRGLNDLRTRLRDAGRITYTGWPPFVDLNERGWTASVFEDFVEAWLGKRVEDAISQRTSATSDFWRASPGGKLYTIRGYTEDDLMGSYTYHTGDFVGPGEVIDLTYPVRRVAEGCLFAERLAETYDEVEGIIMSMRFTGLKGRRLISLTKSRGYHESRISDTDDVVLRATATPQQVRNNIVEIIHDLLTPLYEKFSFYQISSQLVSEEIEDMRHRRG